MLVNTKVLTCLEATIALMLNINVQQEVPEVSCARFHIWKETRFPDKGAQWSKQFQSTPQENQIFTLSRNGKSCYDAWIQVSNTSQMIVTLVCFDLDSDLTYYHPTFENWFRTKNKTSMQNTRNQDFQPWWTLEIPSRSHVVQYPKHQRSTIHHAPCDTWRGTKWHLIKKTLVQWSDPMVIKEIGRASLSRRSSSSALLNLIYLRSLTNPWCAGRYWKCTYETKKSTWLLSHCAWWSQQKQFKDRCQFVGGSPRARCLVRVATKFGKIQLQFGTLNQCSNKRSKFNFSSTSEIIFPDQETMCTASI